MEVDQFFFLLIKIFSKGRKKLFRKYLADCSQRVLCLILDEVASFDTYPCSTSYNLGDMMLMKCVFHSRGHATKRARSDVVAAVNVIADEFVAVDSEVLEQFCVMTAAADEHAAEAVAGLEIVIAVAELEFQYL